MTKTKESPKILLFNFDQKTANNVQKTTGVEVVRGYIQDHDHHTSNGRTGKQELYFSFYAPTPPYEAAMVFINLDNYKSSSEEFGAKIKEWSETDTNNLWKYWATRRTLVVFFVGVTSARKLIRFGVPLTLEPSSGVDKQSIIKLPVDHDHLDIITAIDEQLVMPTAMYINLSDNDNLYYRMGTKAHALISNRNGDYLAVAMSKSRDDYQGNTPGVLVLPQLSQQSSIISKIVKHFADYYEVQLSDADWFESDMFYPQNNLKTLTGEIRTIIDDAQQKVDARQKKIADIKKDHSYLKDLLTEQGDPLVEAVYKVLTEILSMTVIKSDETNGSNPKEDLLVEHSGNILIEVKGTKRQNPSLKFPQQAMQHAIRQGLGGINATGLILNHDKESDPATRTLPYSDKESKELIADIHFIDTRVLHAVVVDVLDGKLTTEDAIKVLFGTVGRAEYTK